LRSEVEQASRGLTAIAELLVFLTVFGTLYVLGILGRNVELAILRRWVTFRLHFFRL